MAAWDRTTARRSRTPGLALLGPTEQRDEGREFSTPSDEERALHPFTHQNRGVEPAGLQAGQETPLHLP